MLSRLSFSQGYICLLYIESCVMDKIQRGVNSRTVLAFLLIGVGLAWLIQRMGVYIDFPGLHWPHFFFPFRHLFNIWGGFHLSWQVVFIVVGLILLAGKRSFGVVLIVLGGLFLAPKILLFPHLTLSFLLPVLLIISGVILIARLN